jgi:uncharacterized surface protein with fasciclin (FAS1) repeats
MRATRSRLFGSLGIVAVLAVGAVACSDDSDSGTSDSPTTTAMGSGSDMGSGTTMGNMEGDMAALTEANIGPACSAVPASGAGSFEGMAEEPAATAASANPVLSTLVSAVQAADLVDTLNGEGPFTIFAPTNDAFAKIPADTLNAVLADPSGQLTDILTYHVVAGDYDAAELVEMGEAETVQGGMVEVALDGETVTINGESAVVCGNVQVGNGTVHIIDTVLMPTM